MSYGKKEPGEAILEEFPGLTVAELESVNDLYDHYLFYKKDGLGRKVSTSCCHQREHYFGYGKDIFDPDDWNILHAKHGEKMACPFCGKQVTVQSIGMARSCTSLKRFIPVVFLSASEDGKTVYAQAYWTVKDYRGNYAAEPLYAVTRVYRFRLGEALQWEERWDNGNKTRMCHMDRKFIAQPFDLDGGNCDGYRVMGLECLERSFLRYTQYQNWELRHADEGRYRSLIRYLGLAALYPEGVEMLMKAGVTAPIGDYICGHIKNYAVLRWGEKDPRKAFGLSKEELREFLGTKREMETLYILRAFRRAGIGLGVSDATAAVRELNCYRHRPRETAAVCAAAGIKPGKLLRYLDRYTGGCHAGGYRCRSDILSHWWDYIDAAKRLGYDMTVPGVLMPRDLQEAHDNAVALVRRQEEARLTQERAERDKDVQERLRLQKRAFEKRLTALCKRYEYSDGEYLIRVAESAKEIIAEGKALEHCVAGYAERHMSGALTILFLRRRDAPDKSVVTIQMDGKVLRQAHGYKNDVKPSLENPECIPARTLYAKILDPWLKWVAGGSKRDKKGQPIQLEEKKEVHAA